MLLDDPAKGLIVEHYMWREMLWQQDDSVLCVAADSYYDADDYIRDYDTFCARWPRRMCCDSSKTPGAAGCRAHAGMDA